MNPADYEGILWSSDIENTLKDGIPAYGSGLFSYCVACAFFSLCFLGMRLFHFIFYFGCLVGAIVAIWVIIVFVCYVSQQKGFFLLEILLMHVILVVLIF
jgi:hypothetical protein